MLRLQWDNLCFIVPQVSLLLDRARWNEWCIKTNPVLWDRTSFIISTKVKKRRGVEMVIDKTNVYSSIIIIV